jgi:hypothetical protein
MEVTVSGNEKSHKTFNCSATSDLGNKTMEVTVSGSEKGHKSFNCLATAELATKTMELCFRENPRKIAVTSFSWFINCRWHCEI